jgi:LysM repeat protein
MNTPSPLIPQGTFPDNRGRSHIRLAVFAILAVHVVLLGGLLMLGCRKPAADETAANTLTNNYPPVVVPPESNPPSVAQTPTPPPVVISNPPVTPTPVAPPTDLVPPSSGKEHVVVKGDSFYTLGKKYGVTGKAIQEANPAVDSSKLKIGQKLVIPGATASVASATPHNASNGHDVAGSAEKSYTVKSGDNLMKIAKANGISLKSLRSANALKTDQIKVGQKLKIPAKTAAPVAEAPSVPGSSTITATNPVP